MRTYLLNIFLAGAFATLLLVAVLLGNYLTALIYLGFLALNLYVGLNEAPKLEKVKVKNG